MKKVFQSAALDSLKQELAIGQNDPWTEAAVTALFKGYLCETESSADKAEAEDMARAVSLNALRNKFDAIIDYSENYFEFSDLDRKGLTVAVICGEVLEMKDPAIFKELHQLDRSALARGRGIWEKSQDYLKSLPYLQNCLASDNVNIEALFCATLELRDRISGLTEELNGYDSIYGARFCPPGSLIDCYDEDIAGQASCLLDPETDVGRDIQRELLLLERKMARVFGPWIEAGLGPQQAEKALDFSPAPL